MSCNYEFYLMNTLIHVNIDQGITKKVLDTTLVILINWAYVSLKWEDILKADNNRRRQQQQNRIVTYALLASSISLLVTLLFLSLCQNWSWILVQLKVRSYKRSMYVLQDYQFKLAYDLLSRVEFRVVPLYLQGR